MIPVSRAARDRFPFEDAPLSPGGIRVPHPHAARVLAQRLNRTRDVLAHPEQTVHAAELYALALIDDIFRHIVALYCQQHNPRLFAQMLDWLQEQLGASELERTLLAFVSEFPPPSPAWRQTDPRAYLDSRTEEGPAREMLLRDTLMVWLANRNPAVGPLIALFDDRPLSHKSAYEPLIGGMRRFLDTQPPFGPAQQQLLDMLRSPALAVPHSLAGQLEYIRTHWGPLLGPYLQRLLGALDAIREEQAVRLAGPGPALLPRFEGLGHAPERFSPDLDWMPRLVLMAKNVHVWLDQLSKQYGRRLTRLDEIPDEELDRLACWGFTGLWLIGVWERSPASQRIKQLCGNPEAVASAYSIYDYQIAADLGGAAAFEVLKRRAAGRGIRLASDMVPNHMGIDSPWVIEHPPWFIGLDHSPFPAYTFNGPNLSSDERVAIYLEDHYYDRSDAAVVFKRVDRTTGSERYIYHGNDGTSMPWNDTAQLDYLNPEVREAVMQAILHVARQFPVIRFDAAMTLTKQHYQRLWYPEPGSGGAIPSRAEHGMTKAEFDAAMPEEFWRQVVDRVAAEAPDTLLLAEAFWLLEGYFVRTLGMHRVYNSAFMNMLRDEDNARYRQVIKNTLAYDPRILKRYVNFMNNPDERTAVDQFGKGDKYFGICTMLATLPGLPMFGHGQIEGFAEKYGMEYRRAYWDEQPDAELIARHERQIFPLLRQRALFAEAENFRLYDLVTASGSVNEDVFAYSNRMGDERALVVYHNRYAEARGWIRHTAQVDEADQADSAEAPVVQSLCEGLGLPPAEEGTFVIFRDHVSSLEYIRSSSGLCDCGLYVELGAYGCHVFMDFRVARDDDRHPYTELAAALDGRGVPSIEEALWDLLLQPVHTAFRQLVNPAGFRLLIEACTPVKGLAAAAPAGGAAAAVRFDDIERTLEATLDAVRRLECRLHGRAETSGDSHEPPALVAARVRRRLEVLLDLPSVAVRLAASRRPECRWALNTAQQVLGVRSFGTAPPACTQAEVALWATLLGWVFVHALGQVVNSTEGARVACRWVDEWRLGRIIAETLGALGLPHDTALHSVATLSLIHI